MLDILDQFEGHPTYYTRHQIEVNPIEHQEATLLTPWVYFINRYKPEMLTRPMMDNYDSYGPHGLPYVERCARQGENAKCGHTEKSEIILWFHFFSVNPWTIVMASEGDILLQQ